MQLIFLILFYCFTSFFQNFKHPEYSLKNILKNEKKSCEYYSDKAEKHTNIRLYFLKKTKKKGNHIVTDYKLDRIFFLNEIFKESITNLDFISKTYNTFVPEIKLETLNFGYIHAHPNRKEPTIKLLNIRGNQEFIDNKLFKINENVFISTVNLKLAIALKQQKKHTFFFITISLVFLFIIIFLTSNCKIKKNYNHLLATKNEELLQINQILNNSNLEKKILLKEIHHRVKNNLQLVMSLLNIQAQDSQNKTIQDFLEKGQSKIATMTLIHQNLYQNENFKKINFQDYLENLVENIKHTFDKDNFEFSIKTHGNSFNINTAIPLGLIINEIVCNALKHAFPLNVKGKIKIEIKRKKNNTILLQIGDNGIGINEPNKNPKSIGLEIVDLLVMQLDGKINKTNEIGTNYIIEFKETHI